MKAGEGEREKERVAVPTTSTSSQLCADDSLATRVQGEADIEVKKMHAGSLRNIKTGMV